MTDKKLDFVSSVSHCACL